MDVRKTAVVPAALLLALLSGCLEQHLVWSPNGQRAAVIAKDGLHLCDPDGNLTPLLLPDVDMVAWFSDSQRLAVARVRKAGDWASVARAAGSERASAIAVEAEGIWSKLEAGEQWGAVMKPEGMKKGIQPLLIFLRDHHREALRAKLTPGDWDGLMSSQAEVADLLVVRIDGDQIRPGTVLHEGLEKIEDLRVSPGNRAIAFTTDLTPDNDDECRLLLTLADAVGTETVAERTAAYPDWTPDARSLVYAQAAEGGKKDDLRLATLVRREVLDDRGQIKLQEKPDELAGMVFSRTRVRCLRDGRIVFNAVEFSLPVATKDVDAEREKLFFLDPLRQTTLGRLVPRGEEANLPKNLTFFEPSPDEKQILVGGFEGEVSVLTLATGDVAVWQKTGDYGLRAAPVWRSSDEITYARRNPAENGKPPVRKAEIVLRKSGSGKGDQETVLSKGWSDEMLASVFSPSDQKM
jgi:dipeptidyl aminopeptidase/acylaminoacyl peptidase